MPFFLGPIFALLMKWFNPETIINGAINAYMKAKDVDLEKFKSSEITTEAIVGAILTANVQFAQLKAQYALSVLQWWPFRLILFVLISVATMRFSLAAFDSTWWWIFGCTIKGQHVVGDACSWSFPAILGTFGEAEKQFLLFFIIAKPVDTAVSGGLAAVQKYIDKK
jgi:hypothetical protein